MSLLGTQDPLVCLGTDLFVDILSHLDGQDLLQAERVSHCWHDCSQAFSSGLWRRAALRAPVEPSDVYACDSLATEGRWTVDEHDRRPVVDDVGRLLDPPTIRHWATRSVDSPGPAFLQLTSTPLDTPLGESVRVNWRYVCQSHKQLQTAWSTARCRLRWITPPTNTVWRIKSNPEQNVLLCTSRMSGMTVVDRVNCKPIFAIEGMEGYAHLEAGRGFAVFDTPGHVQPLAGLQFDASNSNTALEVWRTGEARARSRLPRAGYSSVADSAVSYTHDDEFHPGVQDEPLPRGHMEHFRTLEPSARCLAFRLHVDDADSENPRAIVAAAGSSAVYIWHLEENREMETIERGWEDHGRPNYIELDDEFAFICLDRQMHVYSRQTLRHLASFPPLRASAKDAANLAFPLSLAEDFKAIPDAERVRANPGKTEDGVPAPIGRAVVTGAYKGTPEFDDAVLRGIAMHPVRLLVDQEDDIEYGFTAVHFTSTDLVCTARSGAVFIVRDYARVFHEAALLAAPDRSHHIAQNTIIIGLGTTIRQLTTYRDHIIVCTSFNVIIFEGDRLPALPAKGEDPVDPTPTLRAHVLLGNHPQAMKMSSCIQADARSIYLTYWATGEMDATGGTDPRNPAFPPEAALEGFGMCVKVWTFGLD